MYTIWKPRIIKTANNEGRLYLLIVFLSFQLFTRLDSCLSRSILLSRPIFDQHPSPTPFKRGLSSTLHILCLWSIFTNTMKCCFLCIFNNNKVILLWLTALKVWISFNVLKGEVSYLIMLLIIFRTFFCQTTKLKNKGFSMRDAKDHEASFQRTSFLFPQWIINDFFLFSTMGNLSWKPTGMNGPSFTNTLRPGVNFTNVLRTAFTYVSCSHSFFVPTFLGFYFTGISLPTQKLRVECWWNWAQLSGRMSYKELFFTFILGCTFLAKGDCRKSCF